MSNPTYDNDTLTRLETLVEDSLRLAKRQGASAAEADISTSSGLAVNVRLGEVETVEHTRDKALGVTVYFGHKKGSASTTDFTPQAISDSVDAACAIARYTSDDECAGLADPELMATEIPDLELYAPWPVSAESAITLALETENAARGFDSRITNSDGAGVAQFEGGHVYGNTHGFVGSMLSSRHSVSCTVIAEHDGAMQRDYWYTVARKADGLEEAADVGKRAAERTIKRLGAKQLNTCTVPVLYSPDVSRGLISHFLGAIRGASLYRKASFLLDHLDKQVFPERIRIHEQPHLKGALGSSAFDGEGVATKARDIVSEGVLRGYVLNSYAARKLGMQTTANAGGVHNVTVEPDDLDFAALLQQMDKGLVVTEMMGTGINTVTGDYSRGASGFWVENGEIQYPVEEITVAGNLKDMFNGIVAIGNDVDTRGNVRCGSILIEQMTVAGA